MDSQAQKSRLGDMSDKPRIAYTDLAWSAAFARIEEGQKLSGPHCEYVVDWKHHDPDWLCLIYRDEKKQRRVMVRKGDPLLLELRPE